jgi:hypothetical protein
MRAGSVFTGGAPMKRAKQVCRPVVHSVRIGKLLNLALFIMAMRVASVIASI